MTNDEARPAVRPRIARTAALLAGTLFGAIAVLHGLWAAGITWPFSNKESLAETVFGGPASTFPPPVATMVVAVLIAVAAMLVTGRGGWWGARVPRWVFAVGTWGVAAVLFLRAVFYGPASIGADAINASWELALYTPLCLALALLCAVVARSDTRPRPMNLRDSGHHQVLR